MRMIDADALIEDIDGDLTDSIAEGRAIEKIMNAPTIEERKTGHWIDAEWVRINTGEKRKGRRCSACGSGYFRYDVSVNTVSDIPNYCPNCGADMRGEGHER